MSCNIRIIAEKSVRIRILPIFADMKMINFFLPLLMLIPSCSSSNGTQETETNESEERIQLVGAYTGQREPTAEELNLFRKVAPSSEMELTPISVSTQVVAGLNYKFLCSYEDKTDGSKGRCLIVIYKDLQGNASHTSVTKE